MGIPDGFALDRSAARLVLVDGRFAPGLSRLDLPAGIWLGSTRTAIVERPDLVTAFAADTSANYPFAALNAAFFADGFVLHVGAGVVLDGPIEIVHLASGAGDASLHTRSLIDLGAGSRATVVETYAGGGKYWRNDFALWRIERDAALTRIALVEESDEAIHFEDIDAVLLTEHAKLDAFALLLGGGTVRQEISHRGGGGEWRMPDRWRVCRVGWRRSQPRHHDRSPIARRQNQRTDQGRRGRARPRRVPGQDHRPRGSAADRRAARQAATSSSARRASIDTKPELEILADDVKCAHGASVGELDEAALFYLRARGIPTEEARRLLIEGFLREPIEGIADPAIREHLLRRLSLRLARLEDA